MRWEIRCRIILKTTLQEKERVHYSTTIWFHKFIPMPQDMKIPAAKAAVDKEWEVTDVLGAFKFQDQKIVFETWFELLVTKAKPSSR